jgi:hypothetical protein
MFRGGDLDNMKNIIAAAAAVLAVSACATTAVRPTCPDKAAADYYFAKGVLEADRRKLDQYASRWFSKHLAAMGEPSLSCEAEGRTYRFIWLRTFHHPIAVRVTEMDGKYSLVAVELDGMGGYDPGKVLNRKELVLSEREGQDLRSAMESAGFWKMPTDFDRAAQDGAIVTFELDGARWILEAADDGRYHVVFSSVTMVGESVRDIGLLFLRLARLELSGDEVY